MWTMLSLFSAGVPCSLKSKHQTFSHFNNNKSFTPVEQGTDSSHWFVALHMNRAPEFFGSKQLAKQLSAFLPQSTMGSTALIPVLPVLMVRAQSGRQVNAVSLALNSGHVQLSAAVQLRGLPSVRKLLRRLSWAS